MKSASPSRTTVYGRISTVPYPYRGSLTAQPYGTGPASIILVVSRKNTAVTRYGTVRSPSGNTVKPKKYKIPNCSSPTSIGREGEGGVKTEFDHPMNFSSRTAVDLLS